MADIKFSQFTNTPTPNANSYFVGYNSVTGINARTTLTDLIAAIGAPTGSGTANFVTKWSGTNTLTDSLIQDNGNQVNVYGISESLLYLDKTQPFSFLLSTDFSGILNGIKLVTIGDVFQNYNGTTILVDLDAQVIKTQNGSEDKGIVLDFVNNVYFFGNKDSNPNQLYIDVNEIILGDVFNNINSTKFIIDDANQIIKTQSQFADKGLRLDFANNQYSLGDYDGAVNGITLLVNDAAQLISFFSPRVQYTGQDSATIAAFTGNAAGQLAYDSDLNSFQYYNGSAWAAVAPKATYMMTGVFSNMYGGDPGGNLKDVLEWVGSTPAANHSSTLPILQDCRIIAAGFKWISTSIHSIPVGSSWTVNLYKLNNPLTDNATIDGNYSLVGTLNITLTSADNGTYVGKFSSGLNLVLTAGDMIRIAGDESGPAIGTTTDEAQLSVLFEVI